MSDVLALPEPLPEARSDVEVAAITRGGDPTDEELAAIVAAIEVSWPRPAVSTAAHHTSRWRFSGRWWTKPVPLRRVRPW